MLALSKNLTLHVLKRAKSCFTCVSNKWKLGSFSFAPGSIWEKSDGSFILKVTALSILKFVVSIIVLSGKVWVNSSVVG